MSYVAKDNHLTFDSPAPTLGGFWDCSHVLQRQVMWFWGSNLEIPVALQLFYQRNYYIPS